MCYCRRNTLHQICANQISNDNVHQGLKTVSSDDNIHPPPCMVREKVESDNEQNLNVELSDATC
jgi:hypothetical protein